MTFSRKIALLAVIAAPVNAFADDTSDKSKDIQKSVVPYGLIQAYSNVADSQYGSDPDFTMAVLRFGVKVSEGITRAQFETALWGNVPLSGPVNTTNVGLNAVQIRRADLGLALSSNTTVSLGRIRMGGADAWGVDATSAPEQFSAIDGASLAQKISLGEKNELTLSLGVGNSMGLPGGRDSHTFGRTLRSDRGVIAGARVKYDSFAATAFYGMEKNQVQQEETSAQTLIGSDGKPLQVGGSDAFVKLKKVMTARDSAHFEGSLGYNKDNWALGGWYQTVTQSELRIAKFVNGKFDTSTVPTLDDGKYGATYSPKTTSNTVGFGFNADSSLFDYKDVLQKGALVTLGGSVAVSSSRDSFSANDSEEAKKDTTQYALGLGYQASGFALELGHELVTSTGLNFNSSDAEQGADPTKKSSNRTYIVGIYSF
ncbi:MAG: hypothetical protein EBR09_11925 [Proteobacteria bacterium]|nr:hypothetical protein [Pseudomonadota bacterium]